MPAVVRVVGLAISLVFVAVVVGSVFVPSEVRVERRVRVGRPPELVYALLEAQAASPRGDGVRRAVVARVPNERLRIELDYGGLGKAFETLTLEPREGGTEGVRTYEQALGRRPLRRWAGARLPRLLGETFERELAAIKTSAEGSPPHR